MPFGRRQPLAPREKDAVKRGNRAVHPARAKLDWFKSTILPHETALRARLRRILANTCDIDDMVSEAMTRAYAARNFSTITNGKGYLFSIARNMVIDNARRARVVSFDALGDAELIAAEASAEALLQARDELRRLEEIVAALPAQCRKVFVLRRVHGKTVGEIAQEMGLSVSTINTHLARATLKVTQAIGQYEDFGFAAGCTDIAPSQRNRG
ncbi:sigma-70 family RNA polymerase sigma factor [Novosphingobium sp. 1949]|uniref:Sigma-70 family RNA polymerase sigma factor n=1 Tax=Novosphingobium organovorum TaxID=2930092 RepID=A0ABT0BCX7_9SPHN|nr:sigma-70 family RNA polymerase sigma factor [Novosphingobium organovorum]MCJ2182906.1 sigma-70 family RNA polymerase sigma factor [Novosphingobium organovorum]